MWTRCLDVTGETGGLARGRWGRRRSPEGWGWWWVGLGLKCSLELELRWDVQSGWMRLRKKLHWLDPTESMVRMDWARSMVNLSSPISLSSIVL